MNSRILSILANGDLAISQTLAFIYRNLTGFLSSFWLVLLDRCSPNKQVIFRPSSFVGFKAWFRYSPQATSSLDRSICCPIAFLGWHHIGVNLVASLEQWGFL